MSIACPSLPPLSIHQIYLLYLPMSHGKPLQWALQLRLRPQRLRPKKKAQHKHHSPLNITVAQEPRISSFATLPTPCLVPTLILDPTRLRP